jgi:hypothetical protein
MKKAKPVKILLYDLETSPNLGYVWGKYETNVLSYKNETEILSVAWKWLGEKKTHVKTRADFKDKTDKSICQVIWDLMDEADIVVAHNGIQFDNKTSNARFAAHGMPPPSTFRTIDTLRVARSAFKFNSNKLNDLCEHLNIGSKVKTGGFELWLACISGDKKAYKKMGTYNKRDVELLEKVYLKFRPWIQNHPNVALIAERPDDCPRCASKSFKSKGLRYTQRSVYRLYRCNDCHGVFSGNKSLKQGE